MKILSIIMLIGFLTINIIKSQTDARLFRYPDVSSMQIAFVYGGDIWVVSKNGGIASKITSSPGEESFPRFSIDGNSIAYSANYNGNVDIFLLSLKGGSAQRVTYSSFADRMVDWHPNGKQLLIASKRESGSQAFSQFYMVSINGGLPEKLPVPYGELGSFSEDGSKLAYVTRITENYPFKRYRGGMTSNVIIYDLVKKTAENITKNNATNGKPAWHKNKVYYVSDAGTNMRRNIWVYNIDTKAKEQVTTFKDFDINHMSIGPEEIVFEAGGNLYLLNLSNHKYSQVKINVIADESTIMPKTVKVNNMINNFDVSPDGKRAVFEARGELFNLPAEFGFVLNLTNSSGAFDQNPVWSPDGKYIAYWSDPSGENNIYLLQTDGKAPAKQMTKFTTGLGFNLFWSPDSKKIAFIDYQQAINVMDIATQQITVVDRASWLTYNSLGGFQIKWSPDNKWLAYSKQLENMNDAIFICNLEKKEVNQVTSGYYNDISPVFDAEGKYLFFLTNRSLSPEYSSLDNTWIYPNSTLIAAISLNPTIKSILSARNDEIKQEETKTPEKENKNATAPKDTIKGKEKKDEKSKKEVTVTIDLNNIESRLVILPVKAGNIGGLNSVKGKVIYRRRPNTGAGRGDSPIMFYDIEKREEKTIIGNASGYAITADGNSLLVQDNERFGIIKINADQKIDKTLRTGEMTMLLNPREEWAQIFNDTWRRYRDFFYDPQMQQVDWNGMKKQYAPLINDAITRWDVNSILVELISELSAGHTYAGGGDVEQTDYRPTGFLGIDWAPDQGKYKIKRIVRPAVWDNEVRSPFDQSGINVVEGEYILSVNGVELNPAKEPYAAFEGLAGKTVTLKVSKTTTLADARDVIIETLNPQQETRLRHLEWIESNRKKVEQLSNGQVAYIYMPNTGSDGQTELVRQFYAQIDKKGFIIDERFNAGGDLGDRFLQMLNRSSLYYVGWRNGKDLVYPIKGNDGPKVMIINGWAGSGGDAFPWGFQQMNLGPIVGERTLGILVGPATGHPLIDNGYITVPDARLFGANGKWFAEGHGIEPSIEVWDDPAELTKGNDPQLLKAIDEALKLIKTKPRKIQTRPAYENRTSEGLKE